MDTIILLLQRLSDRQAAFETLQGQRAERIDNINYRLTRMELLAEERKGVLSEISNAIQHRMETTDSEMDRITGLMDNVKDSITALIQRHVDLRGLIADLPRTADPEENNGQKLQAVAASVFSVHSVAQAIQQELGDLGLNLTQLMNTTGTLGYIRSNMVSKQYLLQSLNELKSSQTVPTVSVMPRMMGTRGRTGGKVEKEPEDCWQLLRQGKKKSGVYRIQPQYSSVPFFVYCDMETEGGGWTVIQRREDGTVDFLREWNEYKHGFGNLAGEFWLGNEKIYLLTSQHVSKLRIDLSDFDQQSGFAVYSAFAVGSELEGYSLKMLGEYRGDAGDSLRYHVGRRFSTIDVDNDAWPERNCARDHMGAWWYRACDTRQLSTPTFSNSNLNGRYLHGPVPSDHEYSGLYWYDFRGPRYSLWRSRMMVRRGGSVGRPVFKDIDEIKSSTTTARPEEPTPAEDDEIHSDPEPYDPYATYNGYDPYAIYDG
nr:fibrinogen C domain-containing protein 1-like isoform X1 [Penaeus vannamei]